MLQREDVHYPFISTINDTAPAWDGTIFLLGSACVSVEGDADNHELLITDSCRACTDCDTLWSIYRGFEYYYSMFVALKDVALYNDEAAKARLEQLHKALMPAPGVDCRGKLDQAFFDWNSGSAPFATELLGQYVTTMLMWNYAVSINNMKVELSTIPEDSTAIQLQLKRDLASCAM